MGQVRPRIDSSAAFPYTSAVDLRPDFVRRGLVVLSPESLGIAPDIHGEIFEQEKAAFRAKRRITAALIPAVLKILNAPGLIAAVNQLLGSAWAIVPFTHNAPFVSGAFDQHWHKDDNGPYNARKARHHQPIQLEMLYYPQAVAEDMGPTATIPYSQYWTFNHEENHDNFAGADHLDFDYQLIGMERVPVSGRRSDYDPVEIKARSTAHDVRMRAAVTNLNWPLVTPFEAAPLEAGSVVLYSHNLFHRGNHRRDDWHNWRPNPRFMWRFWLYRTTDPQPSAASPDNASMTGNDALTGIDLSEVDSTCTSIWTSQGQWLQTGAAPAPYISAGAAQPLADQLRLAGDRHEPQRIGAAYQLASLDDQTLAARILRDALYIERESVRRAATYGLIAMGVAATAVFLEAADAAQKWVRKAGVHGLGDCAPLNSAVRGAICARLSDDPSVYIRSVAAAALGHLVRRAAARGIGTEQIPACAQALCESLKRETNRLGMDRAQQRSIKFVRPTDESDLCEGIGVDYDESRYRPVRSAVREGALTSLVVLATHGEYLADSLENVIGALTSVVLNDENLFSVGLAMDALNRLLRDRDSGNADLAALQDRLPELMSSSKILCRESLLRAGWNGQQSK